MHTIVLLFSVDFDRVTISHSGSSTAGRISSLVCSATLIKKLTDSHSSQDVPSRPLEWFFGPNGNAPLPSGILSSAILSENGKTYTSTLLFSPLSQSHAGTYTCRIGAGTLVASTEVFANGIIMNFNFDTLYLFINSFTGSSTHQCHGDY